MPLTSLDVAFPIIAVLPGAELSFDFNPVAEKLLTPSLSCFPICGTDETWLILGAASPFRGNRTCTAPTVCNSECGCVRLDLTGPGTQHCIPLVWSSVHVLFPRNGEAVPEISQ